MVDDSISFEVLDALASTKSITDAACPLCGPDCKSGINQRRKVLRIWRDEADFITYKCARCEASGYARREARPSASAAPRPKRETPPAEPPRDKSDLARFLWDKAQPIAGTLAETYLRSRCCFIETSAIRFLPARDQHHAAMIARFGTGPVTGVHLTKLRADGRAKAGTENDKIIIGPSMGQQIVLFDNEEREEIVIAEGIEDAASIAIATGWTTWAAGTANRIPPVVAAAPKAVRILLASDLDWGKPERVRAGPRNLAKAVETRPDLVPLHFERCLGIGVDANRAMIKFGREAVMAVVEICDARARFAAGEIGFEAMMRASSRANAVIATLPD